MKQQPSNEPNNNETHKRKSRIKKTKWGLATLLLHTPEEHINWPDQDNPKEDKLARVFYLVYHQNMIHPERFWDNHKAHKAKGRVLLYCQFEDITPSTSYALPKDIVRGIQEGLLIWEENKKVLFNEAITSFYGVGHPSTREGKMPKNLPPIPPNWWKDEKRRITSYNKKAIPF